MRIFYDDAGHLYAAEKPELPSHAEMTFPTQDIIKALTVDLKGNSITGQKFTREQMIGFINHPEFNKKEPVLAEEKVDETPSV